jgi:hypothetical protein
MAATALVSCDEGSVHLGAAAQPATHAPLVSGLCGTSPSVLAWVAGLKPKALALDAAHAYVVASEAGDDAHEVVLQVPKVGPGYRVVADHQDPVGDLDAAWDDTSTTVVWTTQSAGGSGTVWKSATGDAGPEILADQRTAPGPLHLGQDRVYWAETQTDASGGPLGAVVWTTTSGTGAVALQQATDAQHVPRQIDIGWPSNETLYWTTANTAAGDYAGAEVVGAALEPPLSYAESIAGPTSGGAGAIRTACDGSLIVSGPGALFRYVGMGLEPIASTSGFVQRIEDACGLVLYVDPAARVLRAAQLDPANGAPFDIAPDVDPQAPFASDYKCVYWVDAARQALMMVRW